MFFAHSQNDDGRGVAEALKVHLLHVAERAKSFATAFDAEEQAYGAGLLHDLGKYADQFQRRLNSPQQEKSRDHWSAGAAALAKISSSGVGFLPALAIAGHHCGLSQIVGDVGEFYEVLGRAICKDIDHEKFTDHDLSLLVQRFQADAMPSPRVKNGLRLRSLCAADMLDLRMLFSALVDADFLETEAHFQGDAVTPRRPRAENTSFDVDKAITALNVFLTKVRHHQGTSPINDLRDKLMQNCIDAADKPTGLFSLTAPTGSGKTLAMLAFALHHARKNGLRRIILVMPFLNIIDQTAKIYRNIFSAENGFDCETILEHHSLADNASTESIDADSAVGVYRKLWIQNWDAPIILTTNVQLLESLMADRPGRCRKLHRLAGSVLLFDEVQTLPLSLAKATLATLSRLAEPDGPYRTSIVFATATQPAFKAFDNGVLQDFTSAGWRPTEIVIETTPFYKAAASRHRVSWRYSEPSSWESIADELMRHRQAMCIVNLKRHAIGLATVLRQNVEEGALLHLSTNMCPAHRECTLNKVRERLEKQEPIYLVATQCVEAGVDIDFPVVYRAFAPLDAIAQAAGRCNRHGRMSVPGQVVVFKPDEKNLYPPGYAEAVDSTNSYLSSLAQRGELGDTEILNNPEKLQRYFQWHYRLTGRTDKEHNDEKVLLDAIRAYDFPVVARHYKLIENNAIRVVVPYDRLVFDQLLNEVEEGGKWDYTQMKRWTCEAAPYAVNLFRPSSKDAIWNVIKAVSFQGDKDIENTDTEWFIALPDLEYDFLTGIRSEKTVEWWIA